MTVTPVAPTVTEAFAPGSVAANGSAVLTVTFTNPNGFDLTQSGITITLPAGLQLGATAPATTCAGANKSLTARHGHASTLSEAQSFPSMDRAISR